MTINDVKRDLEALEAAILARQHAMIGWPKRAQLDVLMEQVAALAKEEADYLQTYSDVSTAIEQQVRESVLNTRETVRGISLMVVYTKGRVTWDTKALDGYATGHPELLPFRKEGDPSVSIRVLK